MERNEISEHQVRIYQFVKSSEAWLSSKEIAEGSGVAYRTSRHHAANLVKLGVFDQADVFPSHRYRISSHADKRNKAYVIRLEAASEVFGVNSTQK